MVATDHDRRRYFSTFDHLVESQAEAMAFAIAHPANARGQALECNSLARQPNPTRKALVFGELLEHRLVGGGNVLRVTGKCDPSERSTTFAELRPDVSRQEARIVERAIESTKFRLTAQRVAVVEYLCASVHEADHRRTMCRHCSARSTNELLGVFGKQFFGRILAQVVRQV